MNVVTPIQALAVATEDLAREADALRVTVCEDAPGRDRPIHVESLCEEASNFYDAAFDMHDAIPDAEPGSDLDPERARQAVNTVTSLYLHADESFRKIDSRERMRELDGVLLPRGGGWHPWLAVMRDEVRICRRPLLSVAAVLIRSWRELAQRPELRLGSATVERLSVGETSSGARGTPALAGTHETSRRSE